MAVDLLNDPLAADSRLLRPDIKAALAIMRRRKMVQPFLSHGHETALDWRSWLTSCFPSYFTAPFALHHETFWEHIWAIKPEVRPRPIIAVLARGGGKSSSTETATIALGVHGQRKYALYLCSTQAQADQHVESIGATLESSAFASQYPRFANRRVGKYGHSRGWRRNRLRTEAGFTIDAAGLDKGVRGMKEEGQRPDVIVFDDLDSVLDSVETVRRKIVILTQSILPAGSQDVAILGVQNLIHSDSIFSRLVDGRADFLADRLVIGPIPAIEGLTYEERDGKYWITGGRATWVGQNLEVCQAQMNDDGLTSFLIERQHEVERNEHGMYSHIAFQHCEWADLPALQRLVVWVDPAVTNTDQSDSHGIQADGLGVNGKLYRLYSWEARTSPEDCLTRAILKAVELKAECVGVETDQGGDTWQPTYREAAQKAAAQYYDLDPEQTDEPWPEVYRRVRQDTGLAQYPPIFRSAKAGAGHGPKAHRQAQMVAAYERGQIIHVRGTHETLERGLKRFGLRKPFDLADAAYYGWFHLMGGPRMSSQKVSGV